MRLELLSPPVLIGVAEGGAVLPALLLARRGERCYVQVSRGAGLNHLCWVDAGAVRAGATLRVAPMEPGRGVIS